MIYKLADNGIQVLKSDNNKVWFGYCDINITKDELNYKFCMGDCTLEGCTGQYHTYTELEDVITYLCEIDDLLTVGDYKASIVIPEPPLTNDEIMISTLASSLVSNIEKISLLEARILELEGGVV